MIDCHDGTIVAYTRGLHPNARLANTMLRKAIGTLPDDTRVIVHSDRGCHYRWPEWIRICQEHGIIRSMSRKGCSPCVVCVHLNVDGFFTFSGQSWRSFWTVWSVAE